MAEVLKNFLFRMGQLNILMSSLVVLSASAINVKNISKEFLDKLHKNTQDKLTDKDITDHDRYVLNHKLDVLKEIRV